MGAYGTKRAIVSASPGAAADTQVVAAVANKRIVVHSFWCVIGAAAAHARFRSGTNEIFTGGGATAGMPLPANGGLQVPNVGDDPSDFWLQTNSGEALNFRTEIATELTVGVIYEER
jgi:hypothetical protein